MAPRKFVEQLERLAATRPAAEVVAFYDRHGAAVQPLLRGNDRLSVAAIMEVADTVAEYAAGTAQPEQPEATDRQERKGRPSGRSAAPTGAAHPR